MCVDFGPLWVKLDLFTFAQLANVQTVGIGLYLALAVIQAVTEGGVAGLRRRATTLETAIISAKKQRLRDEADSVLAEVGGLEMGFQRMNKTVLYTVLLLFTASVAVFAYCTVWQNDKPGAVGALGVIAFYLALPEAIFVFVGLYVKRRCAIIDGRITRLQSDFLTAALGR